MRRPRCCGQPAWRSCNPVMSCPPPIHSPPPVCGPVAPCAPVPEPWTGREVACKFEAGRNLLVEELEQLARLAAFRPDLRMVVGPADAGWFFNWLTGTIMIDGGHLATRSADFVRGLVLHESAHAAITRLETMVPPALLKDRRVFALLNVVEDCRIETWMQERFPGCPPWVREYNDCLFRLLLAGTERPPAAQFLNGILTRWWFGKEAGTTGNEARQALNSVWPAMQRILKAVPPAPDTLRDVSAAYARSPVSRCYTAVDDYEFPGAFEQAIRMAQYEMWSTLYQDILPAYLRLLPPQDKLGKSLAAYFDQLEGAMPCRHLLRNLGPAARPASLRGGRSSRPPAPESGLQPIGHDPYLLSCQRQRAAIDLLAETLLRWFQTHGRARFRHRCPWGSRLDLRAVMRFEADPRLYDQLWSRPLLPERIDPHFSVVIDRSGSMRGKRIEQSFHGVVLLCEVCRRVGLPLNVYSFGSCAERLLHHDEPLSAHVCARLGSLPESASGGTNLTAALEWVAKDVGSSPFQDRFVFVLSDGNPNDEDSAREQIAGLVQQGVSIMGLGVGPDTLTLQELLPVSRVNLSADEVPGALAALLAQSLRGGSPQAKKPTP